MSEAKKHKIFRICKEFNLGTETIISFLVQKGIKVKGPNDYIEEDLYFTILEKFAGDKEKAERQKARKSPGEEGGEDGDQKTGASEAPGTASYMDALRQSIEIGVEKLSRPEEIVEKPVRRRKTEPAQVVPPEPEPVAAEIVQPPAIEVMPVEPQPESATPFAEKPKAGQPPAESRPKPMGPGERPLEPARAAEAARVEAEQKKKLKPVEGEARLTPEDLSEKDKKHRKALEIIRRDGKKAAPRPVTEEEDDETGAARRRKKVKKPKKRVVDMKAVQDNVKKTLASIDQRIKKPKRHKKIKTETGEIIEKKILQVTEFISASDLASLMDVSVSEIITKCLQLGLIVSINQRLDLDTISLLAEEYGFEIEEYNVTEYIDELADDEVEEEVNLEQRAPIVTIMGHVDHGKTSLLDHLRKSNIVEGEAGGITQHVAAYEVEYLGRKITFLDTPGHEAFTAMRARGAQVTDIVILVIAADDAVMPQTDEALDHARAAGVKIVIAINKIDKPGANPEKIKQQLAERDLLVEDWGGSYQVAEISAKFGQGIPGLLDKVLLEAEMLDLKANPKRRATGWVIESRLDKGKGAIATVLIENGTLEIGDNFMAGQFNGKVRAMMNEHGQRLDEVGPGQPALVTGFMGVPQAGDHFFVTEDEKTAREISIKRQQLKREQDAKQVKLMTLDQISAQIKTGQIQDLPILVKADVDGSAEALGDALIRLNTQEVQVKIIRKGVGPISESDVLLASASGAIIVGFHVRANAKARELAEKEKIEIRLYRVVYDAINEIRLALEGMLAPETKEKITGVIEIRETFKISKIGTIGGGHVINGKVLRNNPIRIIRDDVEVFTGSIASLKRFKDDAREVAQGFDCGIQIDNFNDLRVGDLVESFEITKEKRLL